MIYETKGDVFLFTFEEMDGKPQVSKIGAPYVHYAHYHPRYTGWFRRNMPLIRGERSINSISEVEWLRTVRIKFDVMHGYIDAN